MMAGGNQALSHRRTLSAISITSPHPCSCSSRPAVSAAFPKEVLGVARTRHCQAEVSQEAKRVNVVAYTWEGTGGPGPRRVIRTRPRRSPSRVRWLRSVLWRLGAGTHQQIGAAIISFHHSSPGAFSASTGRHQAYPSTDSLAAPL